MRDPVVLFHEFDVEPGRSGRHLEELRELDVLVEKAEWRGGCRLPGASRRHTAPRSGVGVTSRIASVTRACVSRVPYSAAICWSAGAAPLYGRFARTIRVEPFDYFDAAALVPVDSHRERAIAYGIVGGTPRYLRAFQANRSLQENVEAEVLAPGGQIRMQIETLIDQERGLRKTEEYKAILRAIGAGHASAQEIVPARLDTYMGGIFERIAAEGYQRHRQRLGLPMIESWARWEGTVTPQWGRGEPRSLEVNIVASLPNGLMLTGAIKWGDLGLDVHAKHLRELAVLADAGQTWAREALRLNAPLLYVTGGTLSVGFKARAEQDGHPVYTLTMEDLYHGLMPAVVPSVSDG